MMKSYVLSCEGMQNGISLISRFRSRKKSTASCSFLCTLSNTTFTARHSSMMKNLTMIQTVSLRTPVITMLLTVHAIKDTIISVPGCRAAACSLNSLSSQSSISLKHIQLEASSSASDCERFIRGASQLTVLTASSDGTLRLPLRIRLQQKPRTHSRDAFSALCIFLKMI